MKLSQLNQRLTIQQLFGMDRSSLVSLMGVRPQILNTWHAIRKVEFVADDRSLRITVLVVI